MPCLPRRTLKHDCNMAEEGETPIPDIPVGFSHKCHVAVTASDIFLAIMQATGQTWAKFVENVQRFQTWAEFIEICKHLQSTGQEGKAFVLTTLNTQLCRVHGISLKHQNLQSSWASWGKRWVFILKLVRNLYSTSALLTKSFTGVKENSGFV